MPPPQLVGPGGAVAVIKVHLDPVHVRPERGPELVSVPRGHVAHIEVALAEAPGHRSHPPTRVTPGR